MRLDRWLAEQMGWSRRDAEAAIRRGRVRVAGVVPSRPADPVPDGAEVVVDGEPVVVLPRLIAWHKPTGVLTARADPWGRAGLDEALPELLRRQHHPVGRLDLDTSGLLLLSRDGALTQWLLHPRRAVPRTYLATVEPPPGPALVARIAGGVETSDGVVAGEIEAIDGAVVRITVTEGRYRMVRRMLANAGHPVVALHRISYGPVRLGDLAVRTWVGVDEATLRAFGAPG